MMAVFGAAAATVSSICPLVTDREMALSRAWAAAKFEGAIVDAPPAAGLYVIANHDPVQKNGRAGRPMNIAGVRYERIPFYGAGVHGVDPYAFWSQVCPSITCCWDVRREDLDYAGLRRLVGQWRALAPLMLADYYPLLPYSTRSDPWVAWQFQSPEEGRGAPARGGPGARRGRRCAGTEGGREVAFDGNAYINAPIDDPHRWDAVFGVRDVIHHGYAIDAIGFDAVQIAAPASRRVLAHELTHLGPAEEYGDDDVPERHRSVEIVSADARAGQNVDQPGSQRVEREIRSCGPAHRIDGKLRRRSRSRVARGARVRDPADNLLKGPQKRR